MSRNLTVYDFLSITAEDDEFLCFIYIAKDMLETIIYSKLILKILIMFICQHMINWR